MPKVQVSPFFLKGNCRNGTFFGFAEAAKNHRKNNSTVNIVADRKETRIILRRIENLSGNDIINTGQVDLIELFFK